MLSLVLALSMLAALSVPVSALDVSAADKSTATKIAAEIQQEEERVFGIVYAQLEAQNAAGLMDIYKEILTPRIEAAIYARYGVNAASTSSSATYTFSNGGTLGYNSISDAVVLDTFFTYDQYQEYQNKNTWDEEGTIVFTVSNILSFLFKHFDKFADYATVIAGWGTAYEALSELRSLADKKAQRSVNNAGGYAEVINVSTNGGVETASTVIGWANHPYVSVPPVATDVHVQRFS